MQPKFSAASDHSLLISFGDEITLEHHRQVFALTQDLLSDSPDFMLDVHPAYNSLLVAFDPLRVTLRELESFIRSRLAQAGTCRLPEPREIEIPVCYDEEFAPDLQAVAQHSGLSREEVIAIHSAGKYHVYFIGFTPGFPYLGGLSPRLFTPRLSTPRTKVPAGSVAIGGSQTGIYPLSTPGGWRLIGRTPVKLFSPEKTPPSFLALGDEVRFKRISHEEFERLHQNTP